MGLLCGDFYTIRFRDDLWPELALVLLHIHHIELDKYRVYSSGSGSVSSNNNTSSKNNAVAVNSIQHNIQHSIYNDMVSAILLFFKQLCLNPACQEFVKPYVNTILWLCCPLLFASTTSMVRQL